MRFPAPPVHALLDLLFFSLFAALLFSPGFALALPTITIYINGQQTNSLVINQGQTYYVTVDFTGAVSCNQSWQGSGPYAGDSGGYAVSNGQTEGPTGTHRYLHMDMRWTPRRDSFADRHHQRRLAAECFSHQRNVCKAIHLTMHRQLPRLRLHHTDAIIELAKIDDKTRSHRRHQWPSHTTLPCHL